MPPGELGSEMTAKISARTAAQSGVVAGGAASAWRAINGDEASSAGSASAARRFSAGAASLGVGVTQARDEEKTRGEERGAPTPASSPKRSRVS